MEKFYTMYAKQSYNFIKKEAPTQFYVHLFYRISPGDCFFVILVQWENELAKFRTVL